MPGGAADDRDVERASPAKRYAGQYGPRIVGIICRLAVPDAEGVVGAHQRAGDVGVVSHLRPRHVADHFHLDVRVALLVEMRAKLLRDVDAVHLRQVAEVVLRGDLVGQNRAGASRIHVAAPDAVEVHRRAIARHLQERERIVRDEARDAEVLGRDLHVDALRAAPPASSFSVAESGSMLS